MQVFGHGARISSLGNNFVTREDDGFGSPAEPHQFPGCALCLVASSHPVTTRLNEYWILKHIKVFFAAVMLDVGCLWGENREKTFKFVITFHQQATDRLPTSYRHITNCRPTVGGLSADCRPTGSLYFGQNLLAVCRPTVGQQSADCWSTHGRLSVDRRPTVDRQSTDRFFGEVFFTITHIWTWLKAWRDDMLSVNNTKLYMSK